VHLVKSRNLNQVIVFSNTKIGTARLARQLERDGIKAESIHGDKSQADRMKALDAFKAGQLEVLVATDVAARGLDVAGVPCVINYDLPYNAEDYVHRIGRTGRAGASGEAIALYTPSEERLLLEIEKLIKRPVPRGQLDVPAELIARSRGHGDEGRGGRAGREERQGREGRESRGRQSGDRRYGESAPRQAPVDDFFFKPYEPSNPAPVPAAEKADQAERAAPKRKVAVLLGGSRK
jgi:superfamily II DNA/RNA helicase